MPMPARVMAPAGQEYIETWPAARRTATPANQAHAAPPSATAHTRPTADEDGARQDRDDDADEADGHRQRDDDEPGVTHGDAGSPVVRVSWSALVVAAVDDVATSFWDSSWMSAPAARRASRCSRPC